jgi:CRISPR type III-associated protein (TIGR04423 family)
MEKKSYYTRKNDLGEYNNMEFIGYKWMSNMEVPELINGKFDLPAKGQNPFVAEANLLTKDGKISISIEHNDGCYLVGIVNWDEVEKAKKDYLIVTDPHTYLTHRVTSLNSKEKFNKIKFERAWIPIEDPLCEGMEVLQPAWRAFIGFVDAADSESEID